MASVTVSICECCGRDGLVRTKTTAADGGEHAGVRTTTAATTHFVGADGVRRYLPDDWWIFELTTFGDRHIVAEICDACAKKLAGMMQRAAKRLGAGVQKARRDLKALPAPKPKALPAKAKAKAPSKKKRAAKGA